MMPASANIPESMDDLSPPVMEFPDPNPEPSPAARPLPEASADMTAPPMPTPQPPTSTALPVRSATLSALTGALPQTICCHCPHAVWQQLQEGDVRVYCLVTHTLIDVLLVECDGRFLKRKG